MIPSSPPSARSSSGSRKSSSTGCCGAPTSSRCIRRSPRRQKISSAPRRSRAPARACVSSIARAAAWRPALDSGHVAGACFDVFVEEPATHNPLFGHPNVVCTPHLGAATTEAQENVALQVAEQMSDYLISGAISNAVNFPSISAEEAPRLLPFVMLAEKLGSFAGQLTESGISKVQITYEGHVAEMKIKALTSAALSGLLRPMLGDDNVV